MDKDLKIAVALVLFGVLISGLLGFYIATISVAKTTGNSPGVSATSAPYRLELVEPMNTAWNATVSQPKFFVEGPNGLQSSANISLPVRTLIQVTIISYDTPTP